MRYLKNLNLLLLILCINFTSCKNVRSNKNLMKENRKPADSLKISVNISKDNYLIINYKDTLFNNCHVSFDNNSNKDSLIEKKIPYYSLAPILNHGLFTIIGGKIKPLDYNYLPKESVKIVKFKEMEYQTYLVNKHEVEKDDTIYNSYREVTYKFSDNLKKKGKGYAKKIYINDIDSLYKYFKKKYLKKNNKFLLLFNKFQYISFLQKVSPNHKEVISYIFNKDHRKSLYNTTIPIFQKHIRNKNANFNYNKFTIKNYSPSFLKLFSMALYQFLKFEDNVGKEEYNLARDWLRTTNFYKYNKKKIEKDITALNNEIFKEKLLKLKIFDTQFSNVTVKQIIAETNKKYILIDFWATWCNPCILGIKDIKKMKLPQNIEVINLSVDKLKDKELWKKKSSDLIKGRSYLLDSNSKINKEFLKLIELKSIPRYILIDRKVNLIDEAFPHPQESQFLKGLSKLCSK